MKHKWDAYRQIASSIRDIERRIGIAASREWIKDELDRLANKLEAWSNMSEQPQPCEHKFVFLRTAKWTDSPGGYNTQFNRVDQFFCERCLECHTVEKQEYSRDTPAWYKGD